MISPLVENYSRTKNRLLLNIDSRSEVEVSDIKGHY